jgi:predicted NUDIX family phosphoesterase
MVSQYEDEMVLVVPREDVPGFQGFLPVDRKTVLGLAGQGRYMPRAAAEADENFKQLIPYAVIMADGQVFKYRRGVKSGESRLHGLISVGVGGHISSDDATLFGEVYDDAFARELFEEVIMSEVVTDTVCGLINDDSNAVGRVHLGVVHLLTLASPQVRAREKALIDSGFVSVDDLRAKYDELETWTQICLDNWASIGGQTE